MLFILQHEENRIIRTDQYNSKWLNLPQFIGSFEAGEYVYFIFREPAVEHINCGKVSCNTNAPCHWHFVFTQQKKNKQNWNENRFYFSLVEQIVYSRIARVCKNDPGGDQFALNTWTTFMKARLNCSLPGEYPFYFDEVQGVEYSAEEGVLYATFSTPE